MATAKQICAVCAQAMKKESVIITGADYTAGLLEQLQVYFWDEQEAAMDIIAKTDLIENWPDAGVFVIDPTAAKDNEILRPVRLYETEEDFYLRVGEDGEEDDLGPSLPSATLLEAIEFISQLKERGF